MTDLYTILGIRRNSRPDTIKRAYRKLAHKHHPDKGGDPEKFREVDHAYKILSDPARRARYDATGDAAEIKPDNSLQLVLGVISPMLGGLLQKLLEQNVKPTNHNLIDLMGKAIAQRKKDQEAQQKTAQALLAATESLVGRFTTKKEENLFERILASHKSQLEGMLKQTQAEIDRLDKATEFLKDYDFQADAQEVVMRTYRTGWTSTSTSTY